MKIRIPRILCSFAACAIPATTSFGAPGDLDLHFGTEGKFQTAVGEGGGAIGVAVQEDGTIYLAGQAVAPGAQLDFALVRVQPNGTIDTNFGTNGLLLTPVGTQNDFANGFALSGSDGKMVLVGSAYGPGSLSSEFAVIRYNSNGSLDTTFDSDGIVTTTVSAGYNDAQGVAIQNDGKVVVGGSGFKLARYTESGALDADFNGTGKVISSVGTDQVIYVVAISGSDQKIVVGGGYYNGSNEDFVVARYTTSGTLDTTFSTDGIAKTNIHRGDRLNALAVQPDGKIVAAGYSDNPDTDEDDFALVRYTENGDLDPEFGGGDGIVTTDLGGYETIYAIQILPDGKILVAGGAQGDFALVRYTSDGTLDTTFSGDGKLLCNVNDPDEQAEALTIQSDGKIIAAGYTRNGSVTDFAATRIIGGSMQGDVRLGLAETVLTGDDIYNDTGDGQALLAKIPVGKSKVVRIGIENDGDFDDSFTVQGIKGNGDFSVKYLSGTNNVTEAILSGSFNTGVLAPGEKLLLDAKIKAKTAVSGKKRTLSIDATSVTDESVTDRANIKAKTN